MRKVFYAAAAGAEPVLLERRRALEKVDELEKQVVLAKKILFSLENEGDTDPAALIRAEGKIRRLENKLKEQRFNATFTY